MKQAIFDKSGKVSVVEVPAPEIDDYDILVKNAFSVMSAGTEKSMIQLMKKPLWKMALDRPDLTKQVIKFAKGSGIKKTMDLVKSRLDIWHLLGYSSSGTVVRVGAKITEFSVGDRVACIGSGFANHAEYVAIPRTQGCKIPKEVSLEDAAYTGIACIGLQSVRQLKPELGENIVVIGLGLIGQMVAQMLRANGCNVIGVDIDEKKTDKDYIDEGISKDSIRNVLKATSGIGADGVIIAASTGANIINDAFDMCRKKGRVVLLGISGMEIDRQKMFEKELSFSISTAFGAGAFDIRYDEMGRDYPIEYVRWTSNRNMRAVLDLLATKKLQLEKTQSFDISKAEEAYQQLEQGKLLTAVFSYKPKDDSQTITVNAKLAKGKINVAIVGAGQFVKSFIIPELTKHDVKITAVVTKNGQNAKKLAQELGAKYAGTSYKEILNKDIDLVVIGTRHDSHAKIATEALKAGKHAFSEKPMALNEEELVELEKEIKKAKTHYACGFNRRYSPAILAIKDKLRKDKPMMISYVFNNTYLPEDHWVNVPEIGGGRVVGEACHIYDLFMFLTGARPVEIKAEHLASTKGESLDMNNICSIMKLDDGSVCTLTYTDMGSGSVERETCMLIQDGNVFELKGYGRSSMNGRSLYSGTVDYGYKKEIEELIKRIQGKENSLVTAEECILATKATF